MDIPNNVIALVPNNIARSSRVIPLDRVGNNIIVALEDPHDLDLCDLIRFKTGFMAKPVLASEPQITRAIDRYYRHQGMDINKLSKDNVSSLKKNVGGKGEKRSVIRESGGEASGPVHPNCRSNSFKVCLNRRLGYSHRTLRELPKGQTASRRRPA